MTEVTPSPVDTEWAALLGIISVAEVLGARTTASGTRLVGHVPHVAPEAYLHIVFPPLDGVRLSALEQAIGRPVPPAYRRLLSITNGLDLFSSSLSIYGHRTSYARAGDAARQPFSAVVPNTAERPPGIPNDAVVVGGYGRDGSQIYVLDGAVYRCDRDNGAPLNMWPDLFSMLVTEARRLATHFDASGRLTTGGRWSAPTPHPQAGLRARAI